MAGLDLKGFIEFLKQLDKLYNKHLKMDSEEFDYEVFDKQIYFVTPDKVTGITPKHEITYNLLKSLGLEVCKSDFDYRAAPNEISTTRVNSKYLRYVLEIVKHYEFVKITTKKDYPLKVETRDFIFYIAPAIMEDDY